jgi:hypothetical protein
MNSRFDQCLVHEAFQICGERASAFMSVQRTDIGIEGSKAV